MDTTPTPPDPFAGLNLETLTIGDLLPFLTELFFLPGNWLLWTTAAHAPPLARFLELDAHGYGGVLAGCVSALIWIAGIVVVSIAYRAIRDFDDALTSATVQRWKDLRRRARIAFTLLLYRIRERRAAAPKSSTLELTEEIELDEPMLRMLRAHAQVPPGCALPVSEAAAALRCQTHEAQRTLDRLTALQLVRATFGAPDGETAHVLTPAGRGLLLFKQMMPAAASTSAG